MGERGKGEGKQHRTTTAYHITCILTGVVRIISVPASNRSACHSAHEVFAVGRSAHCHGAQISSVTPPVYTHLEGEENIVLFVICCTAINYLIVLLLHCFVELFCLH
jgi:hypothetical protein